MPRKPMKPCKHPGCPHLTHDKYCETHSKVLYERRPNASKRGYDNNWRAIRKSFLKRNPLCESCLDKQQITQATEVHHIKPLREGGSHADSNLMALCHSCHSKITIKYRPTYAYNTTLQGE